MEGYTGILHNMICELKSILGQWYLAPPRAPRSTAPNVRPEDLSLGDPRRRTGPRRGPKGVECSGSGWNRMDLQYSLGLNRTSQMPTFGHSEGRARPKKP